MSTARRVKFHEARRHFAGGGRVLVSEYGHELTRPVTASTTTHSNQDTTWDRLVEQVRDWRGRYPNQRFYIVEEEAHWGDAGQGPEDCCCSTNPGECPVHEPVEEVHYRCPQCDSYSGSFDEEGGYIVHSTCGREAVVASFVRGTVEYQQAYDGISDYEPQS